MKFQFFRPRFALMICLSTFCLGMSPAVAVDKISLAGKWRFELDGADRGLAERWYQKELKQSVRLPGSLPAQGIGDEVGLDTKWTGDIVDRSWFTDSRYAPYREPGNIKVPFWLQPNKYYAGAAWYQKEFEITSAWSNQRVVLSLERPHGQTRVWVDATELGTQDSLSTPHEYELGRALRPGKHKITIRVDNRMVIDVGVNSHCVSDHTQGNWNGIVGRIELWTRDTLWLDDVQMYPDSREHLLKVKLEAGSGSQDSRPILVEATLVTGTTPVSVPIVSNTIPVTLKPGTTSLQMSLPLDSKVPLWDEFNPQRVTLRVRLLSAENSSLYDEKLITTGVREISVEGTQIAVNGRRTFVRGTLECCIFPLTGHPPTDVASWKRIVRVAKAHGLNLIRFHSYCPPEAAFAAADELGFYYQVETCWANQSTTIGDGKPVDAWVYAETDRILKAYGNHPSFLLMPYGNEPGGTQANAYLAKYVAHFKAQDPRRLWTSGAGWPQLPENQFHLSPDPRIQGWGQGLKSRINANPPETITDYRAYINARTQPVISHEIGEWCVYPNFDEISKYRGYLKPKNFEIFRDTMKRSGLEGLAHSFLMASGKLQTLCYKEDIESALRTPGMAGFELLDLHDFPGQGTALVGMLDPFWDSKGYVTAAQVSRFCGSTVPLARLPKRVFTDLDTLNAELEVAHFGPVPLKSAIVTWSIVHEHGALYLSGECLPRDIPIGNGIAVGTIKAGLSKTQTAARYSLKVGIVGTPFENDWDIWIYPHAPVIEKAEKVLVTSYLDETAERQLQAGANVLLTLPRARVRNFEHAPVALGFSSIFWNTAWTSRQPPTTLGILCDPKHPALAEFPTEFHSNWQWWYLLHDAGALRLDGLPKRMQPVVRVIDDWVTARPLGLIIEAKVGHGRLICCGFDLTGDLESNPVARQMRSSLLSYMSSPKFRPRTELELEQVRNFVAGPVQ